MCYPPPLVLRAELPSPTTLLLQGESLSSLLYSWLPGVTNGFTDSEFPILTEVLS